MRYIWRVLKERNHPNGTQTRGTRVTTPGRRPRSKDKAPALTDCSTPRYDRVPTDVDARNVLDSNEPRSRANDEVENWGCQGLIDQRPSLTIPQTRCVFRFPRTKLLVLCARASLELVSVFLCVYAAVKKGGKGSRAHACDDRSSPERGPFNDLDSVLSLTRRTTLKWSSSLQGAIAPGRLLTPLHRWKNGVIPGVEATPSANTLMFTSVLPLPV